MRWVPAVAAQPSRPRPCCPRCSVQGMAIVDQFHSLCYVIDYSAHFNSSSTGSFMKSINLAVVSVCMAGFLISLTFKVVPAAQVASKEDQIGKLEDDWAAAMVKADLGALDAIMANDFVSTSPTGEVQTKEGLMAELKNGKLKFESMHVDELKVRTYGDTAIAFGMDTSKAAYDGKDISGQFRWTDVFVKRNGRWQAVASHLSRVDKKT
jgi:ketosteroid isomerase-like protein